MSWTAPRVHRPEPPEVADEREMLDGWLEWQRYTLLHKCAGLDPDQLAARSVEPSSLSLQGLVRHMTDVERAWFRVRLRGEDVALPYAGEGDWDASFDEVDPARAESDYQALVDEWEACRAVVAGAALGAMAEHERTGETMSLRWVYVHMIEEYARHNGHADLLRERIDGATGS